MGGRLSSVRVPAVWGCELYELERARDIAVGDGDVSVLGRPGVHAPVGGRQDALSSSLLMRKLTSNDFPDGHGDTESVVTFVSEHWRTRILH